MSSRDRRGERPQIPHDQLPDYQLASQRLREANFDAAQLMITLVLFAAEPSVGDYVSRKLRAVVAIMKMALQTCERISSGCGARNVQVEYLLTPPCDCRGKTTSPFSYEREDEETATPVLDASWDRELGVLLFVTESVALCLANSVHLSTDATQGPLASLMALYKILVRQQQHVAVMGSSTRVDFTVAKHCVFCGRVPSRPPQDDSLLSEVQLRGTVRRETGD